MFDESTILNYKMNFEVYKLYYNMALAYETQGRPNDSCSRITNRCLSASTIYFFSHYNLGLLLHRFGMLDEAASNTKRRFTITRCLWRPIAIGGHADRKGVTRRRSSIWRQGSRLDPAADTFVTLTDAYAQMGRSA